MNEQEFITLICKHRDEPACTLDFRPCIPKLIDSQLCRNLDRLMRQHGPKWERLTAVQTLHTSLPSTTGVYMFVWRPEIEFHVDPGVKERISWIIYIGKAGIEGGTHDTIKSRYRSEYSKYVGRDASGLWRREAVKTREEKLSRFLTLRPLEYWFLPLEDACVHEIALIERQLIRLFCPPLNKHYGASLRSGKREPAF